MFRSGQTSRSVFSPLMLGALMATLLLFTAFYWLATVTVRRDIHFIESELSGIAAHRDLIEGYFNAPHPSAYEQMRDIGDASNLILDPELGSYYLVNIIIQLIPDAVHELHVHDAHSAQDPFHRFFEQATRALHVIEAAGADIGQLRMILQHMQASQVNTQALETLYHHASTMLELRLNLRKDAAEAHGKQIAMITLILYAAASFLVIVAMNHFVRRKLLKAAEERLKMLHQLEQANTELEHFSYFMAHDLKEPVRSMRCFATLLGQELVHSNALQAAHYVQVIEQSSQRMAQLIESILHYITSGKEQAPASETIDLAALIAQIAAELQPSIDEANAKLTYQDLPHVFAPALSVQRVLQNLILNAIHYRHEARAPIIKISAQDMADAWQISVQDNGLGFDMSLSNKLFEPFGRLHHVPARKGSGLGLSICKKLVEGWGGSIGVSSQEGVGSRFYFTIPKAPYS